MEKIIRGRIKTIDLNGMRELYGKYRFFVWFFLGIILGTFCMNIFCEYFYDKLGIYTTYFMETYGNIVVDKKSLFWYALRDYGLEVFLIFLLSPTSAGSVFLNLFCGYKGVVISLLISSSVLKYGIGGVLVYILSIFPHYITYGMMLWIMVSFGKLINEKIKNYRKNRCMGGGIFESIKIFLCEVTEGRKILLAIVWVLVLLVLTAFLEVYVNMGIMSRFI